MTLTKRQRQKRANETGRQAGRRRRRDKKKVEARVQRETEMAKYLAEHGWRQSGPLGDVWKIDNWDLNREEPECCMTLHRAYRTQLKLESIGYVKPKTVDDDLADIL
jgi:O-methyltransferase involved in polyketide biosynthesis